MKPRKTKRGLELTRRQVLQTIGAGGALLATGSCRRVRLINPPPPYDADEARDLRAAVERLFPGALDAGCWEYIVTWTSDPAFENLRRDFQRGAVVLRRIAGAEFKTTFAELPPATQDDIIQRVADSKVDVKGLNPKRFFRTLLEFVIEGYFSDPKYGGNRNMVGWQLAGHHSCLFAPLPSSRRK